MSYKDWSQKLAKAWGITTYELNNHDYDYEAYYNANPLEAYNLLNRVSVGGHFPDIYKKPSHPTYPANGDKSWNADGSIFYPSDKQMENSDRVLNYLGRDKSYKRTPQVVYKNGYVLPEVIVDELTDFNNRVELQPNGRGGYVKSYTFGNSKLSPEDTLKKLRSVVKSYTNRKYNSESLHPEKYLKEFPILKVDAPGFDAYYRQHPEVAGMVMPDRIGMTYNPYTKNLSSEESRKKLYTLELSRYLMNKNKYNWPEVPQASEELYNKYLGTAYENSHKIPYTEISRYLVGDANLITPEQEAWTHKYLIPILQ